MTKPKDSPRTLQELADAAGVSIASVSRALSNTDGVSEKTRLRIQKLADAHGFSPNVLARRLASGRSRRLGFIVSNLNNRSYIDYFHALEKILRKKGYDLLIADSECDPNLELAHIRNMQASQAEGFFLFPVYELSGVSTKKLEAALVACGLPSVILGATGLPGIDHAGADEFAAGEIFGKLLVELGHRKVIFVLVDAGDNRTQMVRLDGVRSAAGREITISLIRSDQANWTDSVIHAVRREKATACIAASPLDLFALYRPLTQARLSVPRDLSLGTFGGDSGYSRYFTPIPAIVAQDIGEIARHAATLLFQRLDNPKLPPRKFSLLGRLDQGESLGPAPRSAGNRRPR